MANDAPGPPGSAPGVRQPWSRSERRVPRVVLQPLQSFLATEAAGGVLLLIAAAVALVWANSPWEASYDRLWDTELTIGLGRWHLTHDLAHWVSDGLMTLFFLVVGLEIKREVLTGELRDPRAAAVPVVAAIGGMVVPALLFLVIAAGGEGTKGWGIPMATDIAFAVGILTLVARSAPASIKPFLLTLAIVDDIGAILVIAIFYSGGVSAEPLLEIPNNVLEHVHMFAHRRFHGQCLHEQFPIPVSEFLGTMPLCLTDQPPEHLILLWAMG